MTGRIPKLIQIPESESSITGLHILSLMFLCPLKAELFERRLLNEFGDMSTFVSELNSKSTDLTCAAHHNINTYKVYQQMTMFDII